MQTLTNHQYVNKTYLTPLGRMSFQELLSLNDELLAQQASLFELIAGRGGRIEYDRLQSLLVLVKPSDQKYFPYTSLRQLYEQSKGNLIMDLLPPGEYQQRADPLIKKQVVGMILNYYKIPVNLLADDGIIVPGHAQKDPTGRIIQFGDQLIKLDYCYRSQASGAQNQWICSQSYQVGWRGDRVYPLGSNDYSTLELITMPLKKNLRLLELTKGQKLQAKLFPKTGATQRLSKEVDPDRLAREAVDIRQAQQNILLQPTGRKTQAMYNHDAFCQNLSDNLNLDQLREAAQQLKITGSSRMTKKQICEALQEIFEYSY